MVYVFRLSLLVFFVLWGGKTFSQQPRFNLVAAVEDHNWGTIADIKQDPQGYIWLSTQLKGIQRYDGSHFTSFTNEENNLNSLSNNRVPCLFIDSSDIIWAGTYGGGLDRFDPPNNKFSHFHHEPNNPSSLGNDTVFAILRDHLGNLWVGTYGGLDLMDEKTGKFQHYQNIPGDLSSLSYNRVWHIYEDHQGTLWVGCGSPFLFLGEGPEDGGLNRLDRASGKFTRFLHDPSNPNSIENNKVRAIFEDSKGNFWVGSAGNGLHIMDRKKGTFTHYYYDPAHPDQLSRPPIGSINYGIDNISFIREDVTGAIWIGSMLGGMNKFDPVANKITHLGNIAATDRIIATKDTTEGYNEFGAWRALTTPDGLLWITTSIGNLYNINPKKTSIPYYPIPEPEANSFYYDEGKNQLWIGTLKGLLRRDFNTNTDRSWIHDPLNKNSLCNDSIGIIRADGRNNLWIATSNGLSKFDFLSETFTNYRHRDNDSAGISGDIINCLYVDHQHNVWTSASPWIIDKMNAETGVFTHYRFSNQVSNAFINDRASCFAEDDQNNIWFGAEGIYKFDRAKNKFYHYLKNSDVISVCVDGSGEIWVGTNDKLYSYEKSHDEFLHFTDPNSSTDIKGILHILEDNKHNLWISTNNGIVKINAGRNEVRVYGENYGVHKNVFTLADNYKGQNGQLFFGDQNGYYSFFPDMLKDNTRGPVLGFTSFKIHDKEISPEMLKTAISEANEIELNHKQNTFSLAFFGIDYNVPGEKTYLYQLQNYDDNWHSTGPDHTAYFFNIPPGKYIFRVKAINSDGTSTEKSISIVISPPWWRTWWAYISFALLFIAVVWGFFSYRSRELRKRNIVLEEKVLQRTDELRKSLKELKEAQNQLVQREKMASLGELTAGIAHEIQNPLNFVNNFSEVNNELLAEMNEEIRKGNYEEVKTIAKDVTSNQEKINQHGKRADAIVKGMLQHSRSSSGQKEPTDINALADEYLRLSYHGFRAKDKTFNATLKTDFDKTLSANEAGTGPINVIPQDIGRVLLNLYNNAFYAVALAPLPPKGGFEEPHYKREPIIWVSTKKAGDKVLISVRDNGPGIPQNIVDKIFQPFFTTKPTGQGTGLGLSLSYDIIKAHGGELKVKTNEGEGSEFIIELPITD